MARKMLVSLSNGQKNMKIFLLYVLTKKCDLSRKGFYHQVTKLQKLVSLSQATFDTTKQACDTQPQTMGTLLSHIVCSLLIFLFQLLYFASLLV